MLNLKISELSEYMQAPMEIKGRMKSKRTMKPKAPPKSFVKAVYGLEDNNLPVSGPHLPKPVPIAERLIEDQGINELDFTPYLSKLTHHYAAAIIDTGIVKDHPAFSGIDIHKLNVNIKPSDDADWHGHGTHIAGLIAAKKTNQPGGMMSGVFPGAPLVTIKVTDNSSGETTWSRITDALSLVLAYNEKNPKYKISVVNLSFNSCDCIKEVSGADQMFYDVLLQLQEKNIPVVVSAGNHFDYFQRGKPINYGLAYPAQYAEVIAVGASSKDCLDTDGSVLIKRGELAPFSQRINGKVNDDATFVIAPGMFSVSTGLYINNGGAYYSALTGSSASAAFVTGIILLLQEIAANKNTASIGSGPVSIDKIRTALKDGCDPLKNQNSSRFSGLIASRWRRIFYGNELYPHVNIHSIAQKFSQLNP